MEKSSKTRSLFLQKNQDFFRQINGFTKEVTKELISRKFLSLIAFYSTFPHCDTLGCKSVVTSIAKRYFHEIFVKKVLERNFADRIKNVFEIENFEIH